MAYEQVVRPQIVALEDIATTLKTGGNSAGPNLADYLTVAQAQETYATILGVQSAYLRIDDAAKEYEPIGGLGLPYDVAMPFMGSYIGPVIQGVYISLYRFVRQVTFPAGFLGSVASCIQQATNAQSLQFSGWSTNPLGFDGAIGHINYVPGNNTGSIVTNTGRAALPITFYPGDGVSLLTVINGNGAGTPLDPTLQGISVTLLGTISG